MVLEGLISPIKAEKNPWELFFIGILYSSIALVMSLVLFQDYASIIMVFFTVAASIPLVYWTLKLEEKKDLWIHEEKILIKEHGKALAFLTFLFLGFVFSFTIWYLFLPATTSAKLFEVQTNTITEINNPMTGNAINIASTLTKILINNMKVLLFCLIFAFFYGFGSLFILTWNASIIGVAIGDLVKTTIGSYISVLPFAMVKYLIHGVPEMFAYFMAGLAGGIISIAVIRHDYKSGRFAHILLDSADMVFGAVVLLIIAALLEVFVSPLVL
jgi:uncharacterized membrane protein SpoIIM required for sporulation